MSRLMWLFLIVLLAVPAAFSHDEDGDVGTIDTSDVIDVRSFSFARSAKVHVIVTKDGHTYTQPMRVLIKVDCGGQETDWQKLPIHETESACAMDPKSVKFDAGVVTLKVYGPDVDSLNDPANAGKEPERAPCAKTPETRMFSVKKLCLK